MNPTQTLCARRVFSTSLATALFLALVRSASAQDVWTGADAVNSAKWTDGTNWQAGATPLPFDSLTFSGTVIANNNDFANGTAFDGITFASGASGFNLTGNSILLSGNSAGTNNAVLNNSGIGQTVGLNLGLDWGYYTFTGNNSPGLALNGTLTLSPGAVAFFDPYVTSSSLTSDSTGLITGLGGAGLMSGAGVPTGLAMISGGIIQPYTGYTTVAPGGTIPSVAGDNIELTSSGTSSAYTIGATTVNTITSTQVGNGSGTAIDTITSTGLLTLGNNGGIYVLDPSSTSRTNFVLAGGTLTAGTVGAPASLVLGVNGAPSGFPAQINAVIQDNGTGGPVTLVAIGSGAKNLTKANTYTGGTYITQGQLQLGNVAGAGTGPVYIAAGAGVYTTPGGTFSNSFYLSPGTGDTVSGAAATGGAFVWDANETLAGKITLLGAPVTTGPGDRFTANFSSGDTLTISGQITGPGTLDIAGAHTANYVLANTNASTPNNWQGGLIIDAKNNVNVYFKMGSSNQIPNGPTAGNVTLTPPGNFYARLDLNGNNATINGLISSAGGSFAQLADEGPSNSVLTLGANNATASFGGSSADGGNGKALSLVKIGAGTQTFTGALANYGNMTVSNGTVSFQGTLANSSNVVVASAGTFDASQGPNGGFTVGANQTLAGTGTVIGSTVVNGTLEALMAVGGATTNIGTLTNIGNLTITGGATNIWYINNAGGIAGSASGWSQVNITNGQLSLSASDAAPIHIKIVSLDANGSAGNATFNANNNQSWTLVQSAGPITGFTDPQQFVIDTSAFANLPAGASQFSVAPDPSGTNLVLSFASAHVLAAALASQTNNAGTTAVFTIPATGATPITYQWVEGGTTVLVNGGTSISGGLVTITTNAGDTTSTLMIANVQDADAVLITVNVTNAAGVSGSSTATLTVIDPPSNPNMQQTSQQPFAGGVTYFTIATSGTGPFNYVWSFNGVPITNGASFSGINTAALGVDASPSAVGSYSVEVSNPAGSITSGPYVITPVTSVPNQVIYEPFSSYATMSGPNAPYTWQGVTNLYNELTGEPAYWYHSSGNRTSMVIYGNIFPQLTENGVTAYPWPGLAGDSPNCMDLAVSSTETDNDHLQFSQSGFNPGQSVYFSFLLTCDSLGAANVSDCIAALCSSYDGISFNLKLSTQIQTDGSYWLGLSKGNGISGSQGVDPNTLWATGFQADEPIFVVGVYQINSGALTNTDDTVSMWFDPTNSSFGTTNIPVPSLGPTTSGAANSAIHSFAVHGVQLPGNRFFSDLRIGTTWASVTPTSAPNLTLTNVGVVPGQTIVLTSENAGNPVVTYQWYFDGTNETALVDGPNPNNDGSTISGATTGTLTISNATASDLGAYTVVGSNTDPVTSQPLTGSASATVGYLSPPLHVAFVADNVVISWPTNFAAFTLEQTGALIPPVSWQTVSPSSYVVSGTNNTLTVSPTGVSRFFQLIGP